VNFLPSAVLSIYGFAVLRQLKKFERLIADFGDSDTGRPRQPTPTMFVTLR